MGIQDSIHNSLSDKHRKNVGFTSVGKDSNQEKRLATNPHLILSKQIPAEEWQSLTPAQAISLFRVRKHVVKLIADTTTGTNGNEKAFYTDYSQDIQNPGYSGYITNFLVIPNHAEWETIIYEDNGSGTAPDYGKEINAGRGETWDFDPATGILWLEDGNTLDSFLKPFWVVGYTFIGKTLDIFEEQKQSFDNLIINSSFEHWYLSNNIPDGWVSGGDNVVKDSANGYFNGSCLRFDQINGDNCWIYQYANGFQPSPSDNYQKLGEAWTNVDLCYSVYAKATSTVKTLKLRIYDGIGATEQSFTVTNQWTRYKIVHRINSGADRLQIYIAPQNIGSTASTTVTLYVDGAMLSIGSSLVPWKPRSLDDNYNNLVYGDMTFARDIDVNRNANIDGTLDSHGNVHLYSTLQVDSDIILTATNSIIRTNSSDGADNKRVLLVSGSDWGATRGGSIGIWGNEYGDSNAGSVKLVSNVKVLAETPYFEIKNLNSGWGTLNLNTNNAANGSTIVFKSNDVDLANIYADSNKDLVFRTNGLIERVRITSDGNVGIGKSTLETWQASYTAVQLGGNSAIIGTTSEISSSRLFIINNAYYDSAANWKRVSTDETSAISLLDGSIRFYTDSSGTADVTFTPTERMRIENNGNIILSGLLDANAGADIEGAVDISTTLDVHGAARFYSTVQIDGDLNMVDTNITNIGTLMFHSASNYIIRLEEDTDTGIYYDISNNTWEWRQDGTQRAYLDLDNGNFQVDGFCQVDGLLDANAGADIEGAVDISTTLDVHGAARFYSTVQIDGDLNMVDTNITNINTLMFHSASNYIIKLEEDADTGIYYDITNNTWEWRQNGTQRAYLDLDNGNFQVDGFCQVDGLLDANNGADIEGAVDISTTLDVHGAAHFYSTLQVDGLLNADAGADIEGNVTISGDLIVGETGIVSDRVIRVLADDLHFAGFEAYGNSQGTGYIFVGQLNIYGGGIFYDGDQNPSFANGSEATDTINFYRMSNGTKEVVFWYLHNNNTVNFRDGIQIEGLLDANNGADIEGNVDIAGTLDVHTSLDMNNTAITDVDYIEFNSSNYIIRLNGVSDTGIYYSDTNYRWSWYWAGTQKGYFELDTGILQIDGLANIDGGADIEGAVDISTTLDVHGAGHFYSSLEIDGLLNANNGADIEGAVDISTTLDVHGAGHFYSSLEIDGLLNADGGADIEGAVDISTTLDVHGAGHFYISLEIDGTLNADGGADIEGTVFITGFVNIDGGSVNIDTNGSDHPFYISRNGNQTEALKIYVEDSSIYLNYVEDSGESKPGTWHFITSQDGGSSYENLILLNNGNVRVDYNFEIGGRINFGEDDNTYIHEFADDDLRIHASDIYLDGNVYLEDAKIYGIGATVTDSTTIYPHQLVYILTSSGSHTLSTSGAVTGQCIFIGRTGFPADSYLNGDILNTTKLFMYRFNGSSWDYVMALSVVDI